MDVFSLPAENIAISRLLQAVSPLNISYKIIIVVRSSGSQNVRPLKFTLAIELPCSPYPSSRELVPFSVRPYAVLNAIRCTIIALIPLVLTLDITLEIAPEAFLSTPISLRRDQDDPSEFVFGAFTVDKYMAASANQVVANFTADRIVNTTFNHTSLFGEDCILLAWLPHVEYGSDMLRLLPFL